MAKIQTLDEIMREEEERLLAEANTPQRLAEDAERAKRNRVKADEEFRRAVANGHIDEDGNPLDENGNIIPEGADDSDEDEDEDEEEE